MNACGGCDPCADKCSNSCCNNACLRWGFDGCYLRGRCADGTELTPLDLCAWLKVHETCTELLLVPDASGGEQNGGYMLYKNECGEEYKFWVCDFLSLASIRCLKDVWDYPDADSEEPDRVRPCDLFVFDPDCDSDPANPKHNKWVPYHIPDAGDCIMEPDENGYFKVLKKNDCGCIEECRLFATSKVWEYDLRDAWPDDPDWPFTVGSYDELIDIQLDSKVDMFNKTDLEVTFQFGFGIQAQGSHVLTNSATDFHNFQSVITPVKSGTPTGQTPSDYNSIPVAIADMYKTASTVQGANLLPFGSWEWQVSRTVIVPKGQKLYLHHRVKEINYLGTVVPRGSTGSAPGSDCSRLHALHIFVRAVKGVKA